MRVSGVLLCCGICFLFFYFFCCEFYLFIFPPGYVALQDSKTPHRPTNERVSWCLETSPLLRPFLGQITVPNSFVSLFIFYILSYLLWKTMGYFSGCLMSSASIQKLFCGVCSVFKCSLVAFVGEKGISLSYSSAILGPPSGIISEYINTTIKLRK